MLPRWLLATFPLLLTACTAVGFFYLNSSVPRSQLAVSRDIAYGKKPWQKLDVYRPKEAKSALPVVMFLYGGGWTSGSKEKYLFVAERLVREGFVVVIPDYVKYPREKFPAFMVDVARAAKWTHEHVSEYYGDAQTMHVLGHSAGGLMGALVISDKHYLADEGVKPHIFRSFVGLAGPYDFTPNEAPYIEIFAPPENYPAMQATTFIDGTEPPMLLLHGEDDDVVNVSNQQKLAAAIHLKQGKVEARTYPEIDHIDIIAGFSDTWGEASPVVANTVGFFKQHSK